MLRLYHDEDSSHHDGVLAFRSAGFDCLTASEAGMLGRDDEAQLEFAAASGRVICTRNTGDFCRLDALWRPAGREHAGILICTDQLVSVGVELRGLQALASTHDQTAVVNRLAFLLNYANRG